MADEDDNEQEPANPEKPKPKSKARAKPKSKAKSKAKAKAKPAVETAPKDDNKSAVESDRQGDNEVLSDALELENEEEVERRKVQQEEEDAVASKMQGGKKKRKARKATMEKEVEVPEAVRRRLEFDHMTDEEDMAEGDHEVEGTQVLVSEVDDAANAGAEDAPEQETKKTKKKKLRKKRKSKKVLGTPPKEPRAEEEEAEVAEEARTARTPPPLANCYRPTGWTPHLSKPKGKPKKPQYDEKNPMPKWKEKLLV
eukprot:s1793_g8.t1